MSIECDASNESFCVENNVLYNKDKTEIIIFPSKMTEYTMPETVSDISVITNEFCNDSEDEMFVRYNNVASNLEKLMFTVVIKICCNRWRVVQQEQDRACFISRVKEWCICDA